MSRRLRYTAGVVGLVTAIGILVAPLAAADNVSDKTPQKGANALQVSKVDSTDTSAVKVRFTWNGDPSKLPSLTLRQNGTQVPHSSPQSVSGSDTKRATVIVLDQSGSMVTSGGLGVAETKMKEMVDAAPAGDQFGVVTFGSEAVVQQAMTNDKATLAKSLDKIKPDPLAHTAMWDGVVSGMALLNDLPGYDHNLIIVTDGRDDSSTASAAAARGAVIGSGGNSGATVFAMGITGDNQLDQDGLSKLVEAAGGRFFVTKDAKNIGEAFDDVNIALQNEYVVTFSTLPNTRGSSTLGVSIGNYSTQVNFTVGGVQSGATSLKPQVVVGPSGPAFFRTTGGLLLGLLLFAVAFGLAAYVLIHLVMSRTSALDAALNPYTEGFAATAADGEEDGHGLSQNALLQRAVSMTEGFAERQGFLDTIEKKLEMAEIPLKAAEVLLIWIAGIILLAIVGFVIGGIVVAFVALVLAVLFGPAFLDMRARMRQRKFEQQLPDMLTLLAGALRAGFSLMQAVDAVSQEVQDPMGKELRRVVSESRLGRDLEDALDDTAVRTGSEDFAWAVMAIRIQREVGGNLSELLMTVAETMVQRERLRREVKALTAEGRISAIVLSILPPGLGLVMYVSNKEYMSPLFHDILGQVLLGLSAIGMVVGFLWMRKVVQIDV